MSVMRHKSDLHVIISEKTSIWMHDIKVLVLHLPLLTLMVNISLDDLILTNCIMYNIKISTDINLRRSLKIDMQHMDKRIVTSHYEHSDQPVRNLKWRLMVD